MSETRNAKFAPGSIVATQNAIRQLPFLDILNALSRHISGDWGDLCGEDWQSNESALKTGDRLFSIYHAGTGEKFYVITEWDRSATTVILPRDY